MTKLHRRRTVLVDKSTQWAIVKQSLLHWVYHCLLTILLLGALEVLLGGVFKPWNEHWRTIWPLAASVSLSLLILLPTFVLDSFRLSNRFAGPIGRVRRALRDLAAGKPFTPVGTRKGDFWPEIADELNAAVETLMRKNAAEEDNLQVSSSAL